MIAGTGRHLSLARVNACAVPQSRHRVRCLYGHEKSVALGGALRVSDLHRCSLKEKATFGVLRAEGGHEARRSGELRTTLYHLGMETHTDYEDKMMFERTSLLLLSVLPPSDERRF